MEPSATPSSSDDMPCHVAAPTLESKTMRISAKEYRGKWGRSNSHSNVKAPCRASLSRAARLALAAWKASAGTSSPKFFLIFFSYSSISSLSFEPSRKSAMRFGSSLSASSSVVPTPRASRVQRAASSRSGCSRSLKSFRMPAYAKSSLSMPKSVTWHSSMSSKIILKSSGDSGGVFFFLSFSSPSLPLSFFPLLLALALLLVLVLLVPLHRAAELRNCRRRAHNRISNGGGTAAVEVLRCGPHYSPMSLRFFSIASCWALLLDEARKERTVIASVKMQQPTRKGADSHEGGHTFL